MSSGGGLAPLAEPKLKIRVLAVPVRKQGGGKPRVKVTKQTWISAMNSHLDVAGKRADMGAFDDVLGTLGSLAVVDSSFMTLSGAEISAQCESQAGKDLALSIFGGVTKDAAKAMKMVALYGAMAYESDAWKDRCSEWLNGETVGVMGLFGVMYDLGFEDAYPKAIEITRLTRASEVYDKEELVADDAVRDDPTTLLSWWDRHSEANRKKRDSESKKKGGGKEASSSKKGDKASPKSQPKGKGGGKPAPTGLKLKVKNATPAPEAKAQMDRLEKMILLLAGQAGVEFE
jgi:hypothetical protein